MTAVEIVAAIGIVGCIGVMQLAEAHREEVERNE